jgi:hypothetical protein
MPSHLPALAWSLAASPGTQMRHLPGGGSSFDGISSIAVVAELLSFAAVSLRSAGFVDTVSCLASGCGTVLVALLFSALLSGFFSAFGCLVATGSFFCSGCLSCCFSSPLALPLPGYCCLDSSRPFPTPGRSGGFPVCA